MKKLSCFLFGVICVFVFSSNVDAIEINMTAGDMDFGAERDADDNTMNMDWLALNPSNPNPPTPTANKLGYVKWNYAIPYEIETANFGYMTVFAWDIDAGDQMDVYFNFGSESVFAGQLNGSNGGGKDDWENAVAAGTTANLSGWSETTFNFSPTLLTALTNSTGFSLDVEILNTAVSWAAVVDYATISLDYEPGAPPPVVPEPISSTLFIVGGATLGFRKFRKKFKK